MTTKNIAIDRLLNPRSVAIVGASERPDAIGTRVMINLRHMGYEGRIYPVNPRYDSLGGLKCYPSLAALPETVDAAFLAVPSTAGPELAEQAGQCGIKALLLNASGYNDGGEEGRALQAQLQEAARRHGMAVAGPNNMGLINVHDRVALWTSQYMKAIEPGPVAVIAQSGSMALILMENQRDLGFAYVITAGNEAGATAADYLLQMARDDRVKVVLMFLETVRNPKLFAEAAKECARQGKRIVVLKVGASQRGRTLVQAHTGSLAGEDRLYEAYFKSLGIVRARDLDEMLETAVLFSANPNPAPSRHAAAVTLSGGEAALLSDIAAEVKLDFMTLSAETLAALRPAFPDFATVANPVDAWGLGFSAERFQLVVDALVADPHLGVIVFSVHAASRRGEDVPYARAIAQACLKVKTDKRIVFVNNTVGNGVNAAIRKLVEPAGIAYLSGMRAGLSAVRNLIDLQLPAASQAHAAPSTSSAPAWPGDEPARFRQLAEAGVPMVPAQAVASREEAAQVAAQMGWPVVLKGVADHLPHKSELGLVRLNLKDEAAVHQAFAELDAILARHAQEGSNARVVVQKMAGDGVELILGLRNDPQFGSFVIVGPGGVLVELGNQASIRLGPVDAAQAREMLFETAAGTLIEGVRGKGPWNMEAAVAAIVAFSRFGAQRGPTLSTLEINPLIVGRDGAWGVDVLAEPQT
jgi:acyl-CoA synthetase (NDP forming)